MLLYIIDMEPNQQISQFTSGATQYTQLENHIWLLLS